MNSERCLDEAFCIALQVVEARNLNNMHMSLLSAIWNSGDGGTTAAGEAAAATIDR